MTHSESNILYYEMPMCFPLLEIVTINMLHSELNEESFFFSSRDNKPRKKCGRKWRLRIWAETLVHPSMPWPCHSACQKLLSDPCIFPLRPVFHMVARTSNVRIHTECSSHDGYTKVCSHSVLLWSCLLLILEDIFYFLMESASVPCHRVLVLTVRLVQARITYERLLMRN